MLTWTIHEKPGEPLHRTEQYGPELRVVLSQPRRWRKLRTLWGLFVAGGYIWWDLLRARKGDDFLRGGWTVLLPIVAYLAIDGARILWELTGRAVFLLRPDAFVVRREVLGMGYSHTYQLESVAKLRYVLPNYWDQKKRASGFAFDYRGKEVRVNDNLEEAEVAQIIGEIRAWARMVAPTVVPQL